LRCATCAAPLAHDQRYCLACGDRRGPLPPAIASFLSSSGLPPHHQTEVPLESEPEAYDGLPMPGPRVAAVAVMALLAFGVLVGSLVNSAAAGSGPPGPDVIVAVKSASGSAGQPSSSPASAPSAASAVQTTTITTITTPAPAQPAPQQTQPASTPPTTTVAPSTTTPSAPPPAPTLPPVKHVFLIVLSTNGYQQAFGPQSPASYLAVTLRRRGELLQNYYAVAPGSLANEVALISGQGPTQQTAAGCPTFSDITPGTVDAQDQVLGNGCVYPLATDTLAGQLAAARHSWRAYVESIGNGPPGAQKTCRHPTLGAADSDQAPRAGDPYVTWSNPFVYFRSVINKPMCAKDDVGLPQLASDLKSKSKAPAFAYIVPDACHDGSDQPCAPGAPAGLAATNSFLRSVVPEIERSPAYKAAGLIGITFDEAPQTGSYADSSACCNTPAYPNLPAGSAPSTAPPTGTATNPPATPTATTTTTPATTTTTPTTTAPTTTTSPTTTTTPASSGGLTTPTGGGGQVGLLLISQYVKPGSLEGFDYYNHYSLLASIEDLFGLPRLGYAKDPALTVFDTAVYNAYKPQ
jgi:phosphatidylinositol-3-phosphatase